MVWLGTRYSTPPGPTPVPTLPLPRVHPPRMTVTAVHGLGMQSREANMVVGLISVAQLTLDAQISDISLMTEVYNLSEIGRINNHSSIPGND